MTDGLNGDRNCKRCGAYNIHNHAEDCPNRLITITKRKYDNLIENQKELYALWNGGVDNWDGYTQSLADAGLLPDEETLEDIYGKEDNDS